MDTSDPLIGAILGDDFRVLRLIGFGGYAKVYMAEQLSVSRRKVAIKVLHAQHMDSKLAVAALKREASVLALLRSSCFPRIFRTGVTPAGTPYIAMEFITGKTVEAVLRERGKFSVEDTVAILNEVCEGVAEMHARDILHRDLKPGNIVIEEALPTRRHARLLDLGSARPVYEADPMSVKGGLTFGSPPYLSPETASRGVVSEASDIYGLGAITYEMLCGIRAIHIRDTSPDAYTAYLRSDRPIPTYPIRTIQPDVPEAIEVVIEQALARDPLRRFPTVEKFRDALLNAYHRIPLGPGPKHEERLRLHDRAKESIRRLLPLKSRKT